MNTELRAVPHAFLPNCDCAEIWHDGKLIGTIYGADGPGVRIITKYPFQIEGRGIDPNIVDFVIDPTYEAICIPEQPLTEGE